MLIKQISIFLENRTGRLAEALKTLGDNSIDISALSLADTTDFGILRIIVNKPELAETILKENGYAVRISDVIAIGVKDEPGGLAGAMELLGVAGIQVEYVYAFVGKKDKEALVIIKVKDPLKAVDELTKYKVNVLPSSDVYRL